MTVSDCSKTIAWIWVQCRLLKCMPWHVHRKFSGCRLIECKFIKNKQACRFLERKSWSFFTWVFFKVMDVSLKNDQLLFWNTDFDGPLEGHGHEPKNYYSTILFSYSREPLQGHEHEPKIVYFNFIISHQDQSITFYWVLDFSLFKRTMFASSSKSKGHCNCVGSLSF